MGRHGITLRDVAAAAGVSPMTASNALHGKPGVRPATRQRVLDVAGRLGYRINLTASTLKSGRSNIIHIIINEFDAPYYAKLAQALSEETVARGFTPFIEQTGYSSTAAERALTDSPLSGQLFDGEILNANVLGTTRPLTQLSDGRPFVMVNACGQAPDVDSVELPNEEGARAAVRHLIERNCRTIALVGAPYAPRSAMTDPHSAFGLRLRGASGALLDAGMEYSPALTFAAGDRDDDIRAGHDIARRILNARDGGGDAIDGICCSSDYAALNVIRGLADRGLRVPDDVLVIGFDGITDGEYTTPSLSTIAIDFDQLAGYTLDMLTASIERRHDPAARARRPATSATIGYRLIARESTTIARP